MGAYYRPEFQGVAGDVGALAPLRQLTTLILDGTAATGDMKALAPLRQLTWVSVRDTAVTGCAAYCAAPTAPRDCYC